MSVTEPHDSEPLSLLAAVIEEITVRLGRGERIEPRQYFDRHPNLAPLLREVLPALLAAHPQPIPSGVPERLGEYHLERELGRGGMGVVYLARQESLGRSVALKVLSPQASAEEHFLTRFRREAQAAARLHHTNIVPVFGVGESNGVHYYAMQYIDGCGLDKVVRERARVGSPDKAWCQQASEWIAQAADALAYAHERGVLHRDVKPGNLLLEGEPGRVSAGSGEPGRVSAGSGKVWVADFGLARIDDESHLTATGDIVGTLRYLAPERLRGVADVRGDIYALGLTLYELLTLRPAFDAADRPALVRQITEADPSSPRRLNLAVPRDLETVVMKALEREPARRYGSAADLAQDLRRFLSGQPIGARRVSALERVVLWARRRPTMAALLVVSAVAALSLVGFGVGLYYNQELTRAHRAEAEQRQLAEDASEVAEDALEKSRRHHYFHRMGLAERVWEANDVARCRELLAECPEALRHWEWNYLDRLCHTGSRELKGHTDDIGCATFSPDGTLIASGGDDGSVKLWEVGSGKVVDSLAGHTKGVWGLAFSPDGKLLASASGLESEPGDVIVWDVERAGGAVRVRPRWKLAGQTGLRCRVAFSPDGSLLAVSSGSVAGKRAEVRLFAAADGAPLQDFRPGQQSAIGVSFSPGGDRVAAATSNSGQDRDLPAPAVCVWSTQTFKELARLSQGRAITNVAFSPTGRILASAGVEKVVRLWDAETYREAGVLRGHQDDVTNLAFHPTGAHLATVSGDGSLKVWNVATQEALHTLRGHMANPESVAYSGDGQHLVSAGADRIVRVWDATANPSALVLRGHSKTVQCLAFSPDGRRLASGGRDGTVRLWDVRGRNEPTTLGPTALPVWSVAFSPDGERLACGRGNYLVPKVRGAVEIWDVAAARRLLDFPSHDKTVWSVAYFPGGRALATAGGHLPEPSEIHVRDAASGRELLRAPLPKGVREMSLSRDGKRVAAAMTRSDALKVLDATTGRELLSLPQLANRLWCVAFSDDGRYLAAGGSDQKVRVYDAVTGQLHATLKGHTSDVLRVAFSSDGRRLASASFDQTVRLWDVASGNEVFALKGHEGPIFALAISPDGLHLASGGADGTVRVWDGTPRQR